MSGSPATHPLNFVEVFLVLSFPFLPLLLHSIHRALRQTISTISFYIIDDDGQVSSPPPSLQTAVFLGERALNALRVNNVLGHIVNRIIVSMEAGLNKSIDKDHRQWLTWLQSADINIVFSPYLNQTRWGWVSKESGSDSDFTMRILRDLAELAEQVPTGFHLQTIHFQFCLAVTLLHESIHLLTKFVFPGEITPQLDNSILQFGEAGEGFELAMFGAKLVCEWDEGYVAELRHLRRLLVRKDNKDYELDEEDVMDFLQKFHDPSPTTKFIINIRNKPVSSTPEDRVRSYTQSDRERLRSISQARKRPIVGLGLPRNIPPPTPSFAANDVPPGRVRTGPMLGRGKCYPRPEEEEEEEDWRNEA
ncbi:hypothetical protein B0H19DRAFT_203610 [Mycena capillaripes]|nr:hypothetical protein B0H19DRAFT_203610 [Mycena capillaripes]